MKVQRLASDPLDKGKLCNKGEATANLPTDTQFHWPIMGYQPDEIAFVWH